MLNYQNNLFFLRVFVSRQITKVINGNRSLISYFHAGLSFAVVAFQEILMSLWLALTASAVTANQRSPWPLNIKLPFQIAVLYSEELTWGFVGLSLKYPVIIDWLLSGVFITLLHAWISNMLAADYGSELWKCLKDCDKRPIWNWREQSESRQGLISSRILVIPVQNFCIWHYSLTKLGFVRKPTIYYQLN